MPCCSISDLSSLGTMAGTLIHATGILCGIFVTLSSRLPSAATPHHRFWFRRQRNTDRACGNLTRLSTVVCVRPSRTCLVRRHRSSNSFRLTQGQPNTLFKPPSMLPSDTREYRNAHYGFALSYPKDLVLKDYDDVKGVRTITFEDHDTAYGFQIFVKPY